MKNLFLLLIAFLPALAFAQNADPDAPHGTLSYALPTGWTLQTLPNLKYPCAVGPMKEGFSANITLVDGEITGSLDAYVDSNLLAISQSVLDFKKRDRDSFTTNSGVTGVRVIATDTQSNRKLRQTFYFLPLKNGKAIIATCSALADGGKDFDKTFENSMKTFQVK